MTFEKKTPLLSAPRFLRLKIYFFLLLFLVPIGKTPVQANIPIDHLVLQVADSLVKHHQDYERAANLLTQLISGKDVKTIAPKVFEQLILLEMKNANFDKAQKHVNQLKENPSYQTDPEFYYWAEDLKLQLYTIMRRYDLAIITANQLIVNEKKEGKSIDRLYKLYHSLGYIYYFLRLKKAEVYFQESIYYAHKLGKINYAGYNNLIDVYIMNHNYKDAKKYLDLLISYSKNEDKPFQYISAKRKESHLLAKIGKGKEAKRLLQECKLLSQKNNIPVPPSALIYESYAYHASQQIDSAIFFAEPVLAYALEKKEHDFIEICRTHLFKLYTDAGYFEKAVRIQSQIDSTNLASNRIAQIESIAFLDKPNVEAASQSPTWGLLVLILAISLSLFGGAYYSIQKASPEPPSISPKNQELLKQLRIKNELLTRKELAFQQNLNFLKQLKIDIRQLNHDKPKLAKNVNLLIHKVNGSMQFQSKWEELSKYFAQLYPSFYSQLKEKHPDLTDSEIRHCIFLKLNLKIDEVAQILNIEPTSVSSARYRLKKKIDLNSLMEVKEEDPGVKHLPPTSDFFSPWNDSMPKPYKKKRI